jgi:hypothetical protein
MTTRSLTLAALAAAFTVAWAPGAAAEKVAVTITSSPSNATVEWNGQVIGTTPLTRRFEDFFFKAPGWVWSSFLAEEITVRVWKEGFVGKELRLTSGPFRWANRDWTAVKIYFVITGTAFHVNLEPDAISRMKSEPAPGPVESVGTKAGEAWAVWFKVASANWDGGWVAHSAYQDLSACEGAIVSMLENPSNYELWERKSGDTILDRGNPIKVRTSEGTIFTIVWRCFPASIDPRPREVTR